MLKKNKKTIKLFGSIGLCLILLFSCILFPACSSVFDETGNEITFFEQYIDGFKVVYSNSLTGEPSSVKALENVFFNDTLAVDPSQGLAYYYGSANAAAVKNSQWFPDSIRMLVIRDAEGQAELVENSGVNYEWNWTISNDLYKETIPEENELYSDWKEYISEYLNNNDDYSTSFTNMYLLPLKVVMYEVLLGYDELTTFAPATETQIRANGYTSEVAAENAELVAVVVESSNVSIKGKVFANAVGAATVYETDKEDPTDYLHSEKLVEYINFLREEYLAKTKYLFFTKENADKMISYILDEVIGTELVEFDYKNYGPSSTNATYFDSIEGKNKAQFMGILGISSDGDFNKYVTGLKSGDVVYEQVSEGQNRKYNYLVYQGSRKITVEGVETTVYDFKDYYNYRNYIERVGKIIYAQTYDGHSNEFVYTRAINVSGNQFVDVKYDYVKEISQSGGIELSEERGSFTATPATFFSSFQGESFFEDVDNEFTFGEAPKAEYQSIVLVTNDNEKFEVEAGIVFNILAYDRNLKVNIKVRFYHWNEETQSGQLYEFQAGEVDGNGDILPLDFSGAEEVYDPTTGVRKLGYVEDFEVGFDIDKIAQNVPMGKSDLGDPLFEIPHVDNSAYKGIGINGSSSEITEINLAENPTAAEFYKVENSKNGYGGITILDERQMKCSFYEIVFDIVKSPDDPADMDYDFKVTVSPFFY